MPETMTQMRATSVPHQRAWQSGALPAPEEVRPGLWAVAVPMRGQDMPWSLAYAVVEAGATHIIDPGSDLPGNLDLWREFLRSIGQDISRVQRVYLTHSHEDHVGLAGVFRNLGATVLMSEAEQTMMRQESQRNIRDASLVAELMSKWGVPEKPAAELRELSTRLPEPPRVEIDAHLIPGEQLHIGDYVLDIVHTPGHPSGHLCFVEREAQFIITGDHVLPEINPGIGLGFADGDPLTSYLNSLRSMSQFDACEVLPGHEYRFVGLEERSRQLESHHLARIRTIHALQAELGDATVWEYASRAPWSRGWGAMSGFHLFSALMQTEMHLNAINAGAAVE